MVRRETKQAVIREIGKVAFTAINAGDDPYKAVDQAYPDVPMMVKIEAVAVAEMVSEEHWWEQVEGTIDGEIVRKAISGRAA